MGYGNPLKRRSDLEALQFLVAGQPFLTRRALEHHLIAAGILKELPDDRATMAWDLYAQYLQRHLN